MRHGRRVLDAAAQDTLEQHFTPGPEFAPGERITQAFSPVEHTTILVDGMAVRSLTDGRARSIMGVFVPGDMIDLPALGFGELDHDLIALGPVRLARADRAVVEDLVWQNPAVGQAIWLASQLEGALQRQWTVQLGRLKAARRVARVLSELWCRLELVGMASPSGFEVPMTQQDLADMCGTTAIHMNRALGELRRDGLAEFRRGVVTAPDRRALEAYGEFSAHYLTGMRSTMGSVMDAPQMSHCDVIDA